MKKIHTLASALVEEALDPNTRSNAPSKLSNKMSAKLEMLSAKSSRSFKNSVLIFEKLTPNEVKRKFGLENLFQALSFVSVARVENMEIICSTAKTITWLEEWMMCFDCAHGQ